MALTAGELNAYLDVDKSGWDRGITAAEAELAGFQRDANGRLHDLEGRFVKEGEEAGKGFGNGLKKTDTDSFFKKFKDGLASISSGATSFGLLAAKAAAVVTAVQALVPLLASLAPAAGAVLALPA